MDYARLQTRLPSAAERHAAVFDAAKRRAIEARREASDAFWQGVIDLVRRTVRALRRSASPAAKTPPSVRRQRRHVGPATRFL